MSPINCHYVILGSGFAGSILASALRSQGNDVLLVDRARHPRFALGESSTPTANLILRQLGTVWNLPWLNQLSRYGTWRRSFPDVTCGLKRGFSYFAHQPGRPFVASPGHENELLVGASSTDEVADTQWFRADVDEFLFRRAQQMGVTCLEGAELVEIRHPRNGDWHFVWNHDGSQVAANASFVVDATGAAGVLPRFLGLSDDSSGLATRSSAIYGHFQNVRRWTDVEPADHNEDYPFDCDAAAQHHLLHDASWLWMLRFDNGVTSVGLMRSDESAVDDEGLFFDTVRKYPAVQSLLADARLVNNWPQPVATRRLQRMWSDSAGDDWVLLPHTFGFVDPLHSTGIAHSLAGVERLLNQLGRQDGLERWRLSGAADYRLALSRELRMIDRLVSGCYRTLSCFPAFVAFSMFYFAAAITYERGRLGKGERAEFLLADVHDFVTRVDEGLRACDQLNREPASGKAIQSFVETVRGLVEPYNDVGLCDLDARNMYHHTVAE